MSLPVTTPAFFRTDTETRTRASIDRSGAPAGLPQAVAQARTVAEVQEAVRWASERRVPVIARGGGSGLAGGATSSTDALIVDLSGLDRIESIDSVNQLAEVQAGVITSALDRAARKHGLFFAPDPASADLSTIGGNIATNAGGMRCVKYGVTRDSVLGLDVVLANGELIRTGRRTAKGVAGFDLTGLLTGSEGSLGIIVGATVQLRPVPANIATLAASFESVEAAAAACSLILAERHQPAMLELLDAATLDVIDRARGTDLTALGNALVIVQTDGRDALEQIARIEATIETSASWLEYSDDPAEAAELLAARRLALASIEAFGSALIEDICVPRTRLADAVRGVERISARTGVRVYTFAHAGDGNLHPIIGVDDAADIESPAVKQAADEIFGLALELGGTISGEHGIGLLKRAWLDAEVGPEVNRLQHAIKAAFDPQLLLNPGKAI